MLWANQVWANQPDVQRMIDSQKADQARQAQLYLSKVQVEMEQQKMAADQRQFQQSMALQQQANASKQAAQAWEMQLAEKKLAQDSLQTALENKRIEAQIANYGRMNQPVAAGATPSYPSFPEEGAPVVPLTETGAADAVVSEDFVQPVDVQASIVEPMMDEQTANSPQALLDVSMGTGPAVTLQGGLGNYPPVAIPAGASSIVPPTRADPAQGLTQPVQYAPIGAPEPEAPTPTNEGPNPLLPSLAQKPAALPATNPEGQFANLKVGETRDLGDGLFIKKLPSGEKVYGEWTAASKTKPGFINWGASQDIVPKATQTADDKIAIAEAKSALELKAKVNTVTAVRASLPPEIQKAVSPWVDAALKRGDFDDGKLITAMKDVERNAATASKLAENAARYGTQQQKDALASTLREMSNISSAYQGRFMGNQPELEAKYQEKIKPLQDKLDSLKTSLDEKIAKLSGAPPAATPPPVATPTTTAVAPANSYLQGLFKTAK